jgi:hypothetical protein
MPQQSYIFYLVMALALVLLIRRNLRHQRIRAGTLWILPVYLVAIAALSIAQKPPHDVVGIVAVALAGVAGAVAGWYRGKLTHITLDPETGELMGKGSIIGLILILALYVARYAIVSWAQSHPDHSGTAVTVADAALVFGFATLIVSRLEIWVRCRKLLATGATAS